MALTKKVIGLNSVDGARLLLDNEQALRSKDSLGAAQDVLKVDAAGKLQLLIMPEVASDAASANQLVRKSQLDAEIAGAASDLSALEAEFDAFVATKAQANGLASLGADGKIPSAQVPAIAITDVFVVADIAARDALGGIEEGDVAKVTDAGAGLPKTYIHDGTQWIEIESGSDVDTVNGYTGTVVLATSDVAEGGATNRYYTPTRQAAIEAYADEAEADAVIAANLYTDAEISALEQAVVAEDQTFLKLDGSRPMTGQLDMGLNDILGVTSLATETNGGKSVLIQPTGFTLDGGGPGTPSLITFNGDGEIVADNYNLNLSASNVIVTGTTLDLRSDGLSITDASGTSNAQLNFPQGGWIVGLSEIDVTDPASYAAPKGYVDARETAITTAYEAYADQAEVDAKAYTDAQLDTLTVQELGYEAKTLTAGEVSARQITLAASVVGTPWVMLDNVLLKPVVDFTVSGAVVSWPADVPSLVGEELVAGDVLHVWYHKAAQPFV